MIYIYILLCAQIGKQPGLNKCELSSNKTNHRLLIPIRAYLKTIPKTARWLVAEKKSAPFNGSHFEIAHSGFAGVYSPFIPAVDDLFNLPAAIFMNKSDGIFIKTAAAVAFGCDALKFYSRIQVSRSVSGIR